jgi:small subunit ribosomal protein S5
MSVAAAWRAWLRPALAGAGAAPVRLVLGAGPGAGLGAAPGAAPGRRALSTGATRTQRKTPFARALKSIDEPVAGERSEGKRPKAVEKYNPERVDFISRVLAVDSVRKTTKGGRINRFRALVACGNGHGAAGFSLGKSETMRKAVAKAYAGAKKRWVAIEMTPDKGIWHDVMGKFNNTQVLMRSAKPYTGIKAGPIVRGISECFGIETVVSKVIGPRGTLAQVYSTFHALSQLTTPHEESLRRGRRIVRVSRWDDKI